jgi:hypothetical protein
MNPTPDPARSGPSANTPAFLRPKKATPFTVAIWPPGKRDFLSLLTWPPTVGTTPITPGWWVMWAKQVWPSTPVDWI